MDNDGKLGSGMLLLNVASAIVWAGKNAATLGIRALEDRPGTMDSSVVPLTIFAPGEAFVFTGVKSALERTLVCVGMLTSVHELASSTRVSNNTHLSSQRRENTRRHWSQGKCPFGFLTRSF